MDKFIEDLKKYFDNTPREKVLEDWAKSESFDDIGPTMDEFITKTTAIIENFKQNHPTNSKIMERHKNGYYEIMKKLFPHGNFEAVENIVKKE